MVREGWSPTLKYFRQFFAQHCQVPSASEVHHWSLPLKYTSVLPLKYTSVHSASEITPVLFASEIHFCSLCLWNTPLISLTHLCSLCLWNTPLISLTHLLLTQCLLLLLEKLSFSKQKKLSRSPVMKTVNLGLARNWKRRLQRRRKSLKTCSVQTWLLLIWAVFSCWSQQVVCCARCVNNQ